MKEYWEVLRIIDKTIVIVNGYRVTIKSRDVERLSDDFLKGLIHTISCADDKEVYKMIKKVREKSRRLD